MNKITLKRIVIFNPRNGAFEMTGGVGGEKITCYDPDFRLQDINDMPEFRDDSDPNKPMAVYKVRGVVGSVRPYVGQYLSQDYVRDLCDQTGTWIVTFK